MGTDNPTSLSLGRSLDQIAEFWDSHDDSDFDDKTHEVSMEFDLRTRSHYIAIDPELLILLHKLAQERGDGLESLANLWLQEKALANVTLET